MTRAEIIDGLRRCRDERLFPGTQLLDAAIAEIERALKADAERLLQRAQAPEEPVL